MPLRANFGTPDTSKDTAKIIFNASRGIYYLRTPFNRGFVEDLKTIPFYGRRWNKEERVWEIEVDYISQVVDLCRQYFKDVVEIDNSPPSDDLQALFSQLTSQDKKDIFRLLAKRYHPDVGGKPEVMVLLNKVFLGV